MNTSARGLISSSFYALVPAWMQDDGIARDDRNVHAGGGANRRRADKLALCRSLLAGTAATSPGESQERQRLADPVPDVCPGCGGRMEPIGPFPRSPPAHASAWYDTS